MLSTGQLVFAIVFIIIFAAVIIFAYQKDQKMHRKNFGGVKWVGIFFIIFLIILFIIKFFIKN